MEEQAVEAVQAAAANKITFSIDPNMLLLPFAWIPDVQNAVLAFVLSSENLLILILKIIVLLLPVLLFIVALWITMTSVYTILFRGGRIKFLSTMALAWWDILTAVWNYWVGTFRLILLSFGWLWELVKITLGALVIGLWRAVSLPFKGVSEMARKYSQGGVPWVAVTITITWCILEAVIFTYTLLPTISEILADVTGIENQFFIVPFLWLFLFLLITGSFACLYVLLEAIKKKKAEQIIQMVFVELFVLFFEVTFLYRELVDALTPWLAQQSGEAVRLGIVGTIMLSTFLWIGIRGMTWFLFARFGTPTLLAVISRQKMAGEKHEEERKEIIQKTWEDFIGAFKNNVEWFNETGKKFLEAASLPVFQLIAAAINILIVLFTAKMLFNLPFKSMEEVMETRLLVSGLFKKDQESQ